MDSMRGNLRCHWACIRRNKLYYIYICIGYFLLAFFDFKNRACLSDVEGYIYRYNLQQILIIFSVIFVVSFIINEDFFDYLDKFMRIYICNMYKYFFSAFLVFWLSTVIPFIIGGTLALLFNYVQTSWAPMSLFVVNICIVSMELAAAILIAMALNLLIKKNVLVYLGYFMITLLLMISNNVYIALPLTSSLLETQGYYRTFSAPLWIGRIILVIVSMLLFLGAMKKGLKHND